MCGIVGYVGDKTALPLLMGGLRRLEYRGYDSAGVALQMNGHLDVMRAEGQLDNLAAVVATHPSAGNAGGVIVGHGKAENFIASDMTALLEHTKDMSFLEPGDLAVVTRNAVKFRRIEDGATIDRPAKRIDLDPVGAAQSGYKHFMAKE